MSVLISAEKKKAKQGKEIGTGRGSYFGLKCLETSPLIK